MELWIRSQDKERLTKATDIRLGYFNNNDNVWIIEDCDELGRYKTKERALEILDEIQNILIMNIQITGSYEDCDIALKSKLVESQYKVYIMPKE